MIVKNYSFRELVRISIYLFRTKLICSKARLIRFPIYVRGKKNINFGNKLTTGIGCRIETFQLLNKEAPILKFGTNVQLNDYVHICALESVIIGNNVLIASHVYISDNSHGIYKGKKNESNPKTAPINRMYYTNSVVIKDNVWIGEGVMIMPGVTIGEGSIIGAHSIVNQNIPNYCIAAGSPARIIKKYNFSSSTWEKLI